MTLKRVHGPDAGGRGAALRVWGLPGKPKGCHYGLLSTMGYSGLHLGPALAFQVGCRPALAAGYGADNGNLRLINGAHLALGSLAFD